MATKKDKEKEQDEQATAPATATAAPPAEEGPADNAKAKASSKAAKSVDDPNEELVDYIAPVILGKADQTIFCQVNGENIRIKRGVHVKIKRKFKLVLDQSTEQEMAAYSYMEKAQKGSAKAIAELG